MSAGDCAFLILAVAGVLAMTLGWSAIAERRARVVILDILFAAPGELYGMEIVKRSDGKLGRGTVYVLLDRMEDDGLIESRAEEANPALVALGALPRRLYRLKVPPC